mmetsp:Transcript_9153/g.11423  ORF Transcript_9153/g.11423 Transcript_9153/m.11423 type:complete len:159 (-) Transcript_9153:56-532(-)
MKVFELLLQRSSLWPWPVCIILERSRYVPQQLDEGVELHPAKGYLSSETFAVVALIFSAAMIQIAGQYVQIRLRSHTRGDKLIVALKQAFTELLAQLDSCETLSDAKAVAEEMAEQSVRLNTGSGSLKRSGTKVIPSSEQLGDSDGGYRWCYFTTKLT